MLGIYDHAALDALGIMGEGPTLACATADIGSPAYGAAVSVDGSDYTVAAAGRWHRLDGAHALQGGVMAHARKAIRAAIKSHLSGATSMGTRVHANRLHPVLDAEMPCINLEMTADRIDQSTVFAPLGYIRTVTVDVVIKAKAAAGVDDVLDDLCAEVSR